MGDGKRTMTQAEDAGHEITKWALDQLDLRHRHDLTQVTLPVFWRVVLTHHFGDDA
jgi:hypothetical protein